jgi:hypothetical protein
VSFAIIALCVASQQVFIVVVYFVIDSVRKILDTTSYLMSLLTVSVGWQNCEETYPALCFIRIKGSVG